MPENGGQALSEGAAHVAFPRFWLVFDVEAIGLYGEGFAVGYCVTDALGQEVVAGRNSCEPSRAVGHIHDYLWVRKNIPDLTPTQETPREMRRAFAYTLTKWIADGAAVVVDCGYPVETNFLRAIVRDDPAWRTPYPLFELASLLMVAGRDPIATYPRLPHELPAHDPLCDARQSSRLWHETLRGLRNQQ